MRARVPRWGCVSRGFLTLNSGKSQAAIMVFESESQEIQGGIVREENHTKERDDNLKVDNDTGEKCDPVEWLEEDLEEEDARVELGLVGRIWTKRHVNQTAFITTMKNIWQPRHDVEIRSIEKNLYVFQFHHWRDKQKVIEGQPWHFDNHVILMKDIKGNCKPSDIQLFEFPIWSRVYNLPFKGRLNALNIKAIGDRIGTFIKMDRSGAMGIDKSIRIRVMHDVRKPFVSKVRVKMKNGEEDEFVVKYERPPLYCFFCGKVGHGTKDCEEEGEEGEQEIKYGGWLKASPWKAGRGEEAQGVRDSEQKCARALFITKPKREQQPKVKENVQAVVDKIRSWGLQGEESEGQNVDYNIENSEDRTVGEIALMIMEPRAEEKNGGVSHDVVGKIPTRLMDSKETVRQCSEKKKLKTWKRKGGSLSKEEHGVVKSGGEKRSMRETNELGLEEVELEEMRVFKKVAVDPGEFLQDGAKIRADQVAGPTNRALGDQ